MQEKVIRLCGQVKELLYDHKVKNLNLQLVKDNTGSPIIIFEDWTNKEDGKELFRLHIKEAIELKSMIDNLIIDHNSNEKDLILEKLGEK
jgi:uncharacterized protein (DUF2249 family)